MATASRALLCLTLLAACRHEFPGGDGPRIIDRAAGDLPRTTDLRHPPPELRVDAHPPDGPRLDKPPPDMPWPAADLPPPFVVWRVGGCLAAESPVAIGATCSAGALTRADPIYSAPACEGVDGGGGTVNASFGCVPVVLAPKMVSGTDTCDCSKVGGGGLIGGGCECTGSTIIASYPDSASSWKCACAGGTATCHAFCSTGAPATRTVLSSWTSMSCSTSDGHLLSGGCSSGFPIVASVPSPTPPAQPVGWNCTTGGSGPAPRAYVLCGK